MIRIVIFAVCLALSLSAKQPLVVISVDGLDNRYLAQADRMGLKIPTLRNGCARPIFKRRYRRSADNHVAFPRHSSLEWIPSPTGFSATGARPETATSITHRSKLPP